MCGANCDSLVLVLAFRKVSHAHCLNLRNALDVPHTCLRPHQAEVAHGSCMYLLPLFCAGLRLGWAIPS